MPRTYNSIPRPREFPLLGSAPWRFRSPLYFFADLQRRHGDYARFRVFEEKLVLISHPDQVQEVLVAQGRHFHKGRALHSARQFLGNSVLVSEGQEHTQQRKLIQPAFHRGRIAGYAEVMARRAQAWTDARHAGEEINLSQEMNMLTLGVVGETLFGSEVDARARGVTESLTVVIENFNRMLLPFWKWMRHLPTTVNRRLKRAELRLEETIYKLIADRREDGRDHGDLLSMLLASVDADSPHQRLSDTEVRDQALTLFIAGHETASNALNWAWYLLSRHEPARLKVKEEVDRVLGPDRLPGMDDMAALPYTTAVISEAMRLYPPVWVVGRRAQKNVVIGDYEVPRGTIVLLCQYVIHRDPRWWPEPDTFRPERWLDEEAQKARPKFAYFPFGGGARICIGEGFAWAEMVLLLAIMARRWRMVPLSDKEPLLFPMVTLRPKVGIRMRVEKA